MTYADFVTLMNSRGFTFNGTTQQWDGPFEVKALYEVTTAGEREPAFGVYQAILDEVDRTKAMLGL